jgi:putative NADH-flavin reductase
MPQTPLRTLTVLGATGSVGSQVARQAVLAGDRLTVVVRNPGRLPAEVAARAEVITADLGSAAAEDLARAIGGRDVLVCCAGLVTEGEGFVALVDRVVAAVESLPREARPVCWFMAGAALLDLDAKGRRGVDLPKVRDTYWPHRANFERLQRTDLDWRLLCPGPMVDQPALGIGRLRIGIDTLPAALPAIAGHLPAPLLLPLFAARVPEMIVPYADAAAVMLAHTARGGPMSRKRVGIALPAGMRGRKDQWTARPTTSP